MITRLLIIISTLLLITSYGLKGQTYEAKSDTIDIQTKQRRLRLGPFFWFVGFNGTIHRPPTPSNLPAQPDYGFDVSFRDIASNIKFALMFSSEYRSKKTTFRTSFSSLVLKGDAISPGDLVLQDIEYRLGYFAGDFSAGRTIIKSKRLRLDALVGFKWANLSIRGSSNILGDVPFEGNRSNFYIDPLIGTDVLYEPFEKLELHFYGDLGAFIGSELTYQAIAETNYYFNSWFYMTLGYRLWGLQVEQDEAIFTGDISGLVLRLGFLL